MAQVTHCDMPSSVRYAGPLPCCMSGWFLGTIKEDDRAISLVPLLCLGA